MTTTAMILILVGATAVMMLLERWLSTGRAVAAGPATAAPAAPPAAVAARDEHDENWALHAAA